MEKINFLDSGRLPNSGKKDKRLKPKKSENARFASLIVSEDNLATDVSFTGAVDDEAGHTLEELLDDVHSLGDELKKTFTLATVRNYKQAVRGFIEFVIKHSLKAQSVEGARMYGKKQKRYTIIQVVDSKLDDLARGVLNGQKKQVDLLNRVDEIYGLLVNLLR